MSDTYEITADSLKSVQKLTDRITKAGMDITHMMAVIAEGPIQSAIRHEIDDTWETQKGGSYNDHIDIRVRYGAGAFTMTVTGNSVKGSMLITGRKGGKRVYVKSGKAMPLGKSQGEIFMYRQSIVMGAQQGIYKELRKITERNAREILRYEIESRAFSGSGEVRRFTPGTHRLVGPE
jgi:hypothetical protein